MARRTRFLMLALALVALPATAMAAWLDAPTWEMIFGVEDGDYEAIPTLTLRLPERDAAVGISPRPAVLPGAIVAQLDGPPATCAGDVP